MIPADATMNLLMGAATSGMTGAQCEDQGEIVHDKVIGDRVQGAGGCRPLGGPPGVSIHKPRTEILLKGPTRWANTNYFDCLFVERRP